MEQGGFSRSTLNIFAGILIYSGIPVLDVMLPLEEQADPVNCQPGAGER